MSFSGLQSSMVKIIETCNYLDSLLDSIAQYCEGGEVLLISSPGFSKRGETNKIVNALSSHNVYLFDQVLPNPKVGQLEALVERFKHRQVMSIVALGGGSVIDTAKICSLWLSAPLKDFSELLLPDNDNPAGIIPVIAVPTTAGTGAEVTPFATAWDDVAQKKYSVTNITPEVALLDAKLTLSLDYENTLFPALDALSHALESLWNKNRTAQSEEHAVRAIACICNSLPKGIGRPK